MPRHLILVGNVPDKEIVNGLNAATKHAHECFAQKLGASFEIRSIQISTHHQVGADNKTINLKHAERRVVIRRGLMEGADVRITWNANRKNVAHVNVVAGVRIQNQILYALLGLGLLISGYLVFVTGTIRGGRIAWFLAFGLVMIPLMIPYFIFHLFARLKNRHLLDELSALLSQEFRT